MFKVSENLVYTLNEEGTNRLCITVQQTPRDKFKEGLIAEYLAIALNEKRALDLSDVEDYIARVSPKQSTWRIK